MLEACSLLAIVISDLGLGDRHLASLMLTSTYDLLSHNPHVDHRFPSPPSWLQLLMSVCCHDYDRGGYCFASHVLVVACNPPGRGPHVERHFPSPPSWLQLLMTPLVVVTLILVV